MALKNLLKSDIKSFFAYLTKNMSLKISVELFAAKWTPNIKNNLFQSSSRLLVEALWRKIMKIQEIEKNLTLGHL
jgi:hypothetical protein